MAARERQIAALEAEQAHDLAAFCARPVADDEAAGVPDHLVGRSVGIEIALAAGVGERSASARVAQAWTLVHEHPRLLSLLGSGRVCP